MPRAVQGGIDDFQIVGDLSHGVFIDGGGKYGGKIPLVKRLAEHGNPPVLYRLVEVGNPRKIEDVELLPFGGDDLRLLRSDLSAVLPIGFVAVVFLRIMGSGDVDPGDGMKLTHREGQLGRRTQTVEYGDTDARGGKNARRDLRELFGMVARVVCDGGTAALPVRLTDQSGNASRRLRHGKAVHAPDPHIHGRAKTRRAEVHRRGKAKCLCLLVLPDGEKFCLFFFRQRIGGQPTFKFFLIHTPFPFFLLVLLFCK